MIKKIATQSLKVGMYIHDLDAAWMSHPFFSSRFAVKNQTIIDDVIAAGIKHVYIDTERGMDFEMAVPLEVVQQEINDSKQQVADEQSGLDKQISFEAELVQAKSVIYEANKAMRSFMQDARFGQHIESSAVDEVVDNIMASVFRNKDALLTLSRIKTVDQYTFMHSISVCVLMTAFAQAMEYDDETARQISTGALMHDLGKMRVSPGLLNKPGPLTEAEFVEMKRHVEYGAEQLSEFGWLSDVSMSVVMQHHERIDGSGYPFGLRNEALSEVGRMAAIVDVYDALTSNRCYNKACEPTYTLGKMLEWSSDHFGEELAHQFVRCVGIYPVGTLVRLNSGMIAVVVEQDEAQLLSPRVRQVFNVNSGRYTLLEDIDLAVTGSVAIVESVSPQKVGIDPLSFI